MTEPAASGEDVLRAEVERLRAEVERLRARGPDEDERRLIERAEAAAGIGHWEWDIGTDAVYWSDHFYRVLGLDRERYVPDVATATSVLHAEDGDRFRAALRACLRAGTPIDVEARVVRPDGAQRFVRITGTREVDAAGEPRRIVGFLLDASERHQAESLLRDAIDSIPDGFAVYDAQDRLVLFNTAYKQQAYLVEDLVEPGVAFRDLIAAYQARGAFSDPSIAGEDWLAWRLEQHRNPTSPVEIQFADGSWIRVVESRMRDGGTAVVRMDITETRRAEALLVDAVDSMPHAFMLWDSDDRLVLVNAAFERMNVGAPGTVVPGVRFEDVMRERVYQGLVPAARGREEEHVRWRMQAHRNPTGAPIEQQFIDGTWHEIREHRTRDGGLVCFRTDITARKRAERELERHRERLEELVEERTRELRVAQDELLRSERLAAIGQVTATVSHELRNPLGTIASSFHVLKQGFDSGAPPSPRVLARIDRSIARCVAIIEDLLAYTRKPHADLVRMDLGGWLADVADDLGPVPEEVVLRIASAPATIVVRADPARLHMALINVVQNACQAVAESGKPGSVTVGVERDAGRVSIRVSDTGPGMPEDELGRIFEPLFSTKSFGVGLGLPLVKQTMELHGGSVDVESAPGRGTVMTLTLPAADPANAGDPGAG